MSRETGSMRGPVSDCVLEGIREGRGCMVEHMLLVGPFMVSRR